MRGNDGSVWSSLLARRLGQAPVAARPLPFVLRLGVRDRLPLHVGDRTSVRRRQRQGVVSPIAWAAFPLSLSGRGARVFALRRSTACERCSFTRGRPWHQRGRRQAHASTAKRRGAQSRGGGGQSASLTNGGARILRRRVLRSAGLLRFAPGRPRLARRRPALDCGPRYSIKCRARSERGAAMLARLANPARFMRTRAARRCRGSAPPRPWCAGDGAGLGAGLRAARLPAGRERADHVCPRAGGVAGAVGLSVRRGGERRRLGVRATRWPRSPAQSAAPGRRRPSPSFAWRPAPYGGGRCGAPGGCGIAAPDLGPGAVLSSISAISRW